MQATAWFTLCGLLANLDGLTTDSDYENIARTNIRTIKGLLGNLDDTVSELFYTSNNGVSSVFLKKLAEIIKTYGETEMGDVKKAISNVSPHFSKIPIEKARTFFEGNWKRMSKLKPLELKNEILKLIHNAVSKYYVNFFDVVIDNNHKSKLDNVIQTLSSDENKTRQGFEQMFKTGFDIFDKVVDKGLNKKGIVDIQSNKYTRGCAFTTEDTLAMTKL